MFNELAENKNDVLSKTYNFRNDSEHYYHVRRIRYPIRVFYSTLPRFVHGMHMDSKNLFENYTFHFALQLLLNTMHNVAKKPIEHNSRKDVMYDLEQGIKRRGTHITYYKSIKCHH